MLAWIRRIFSDLFTSQEAHVQRWKKVSEEGKTLRREIKKLYERPKHPASSP
jgi:hypothetical protein